MIEQSKDTDLHFYVHFLIQNGQCKSLCLCVHGPFNFLPIHNQYWEGTSQHAENMTMEQTNHLSKIRGEKIRISVMQFDT